MFDDDDDITPNSVGVIKNKQKCHNAKCERNLFTILDMFVQRE